MRIKRLPILASVLLLAACTADILSPVRPALEAGPQAQGATDTRLVHYCVTVADGDSSSHTRATLNKDGKYVYSASDMLFVRSTGEYEGRVYGALMLDPKDIGKSSGVTFEGDLHLFGYEVDEEPEDDMPLEAVLVGSHDQLYEFDDLGEQIVGNPVWPEDGALATSVAKAVEQYSILTAESTYGQQAFQLSQGSCFVNFSVTLDDETEVNKEIGAYVWTDADLDKRKIRSGTVTTVDDGEGHIKANFVAAFPGGTVLDGAVVGLGGRNPIDFGGSGTTLEANKVYHVNRTFTRQPETISFDKPSIVKSYPDGEFQIKVNNSGDGTVTYASEDEDVATVAYDDLLDMWLVTITGAGETDLKATVTDGENSVYSERTVSCHLTVYAPVPLASVTASHVGWVIGTDGLAYITVSGIFAAEGDQKPLAMIGYVGAAGSADASSDTYRGLAIALNDAATSTAWTSNANLTCTGNKACDDQNFPQVVASMTGISNTAYLAGLECRTSESDTHTHAAATAAHTYTGVDKEGFTLASIGCSDWFLPSTGQWFKVLQACGVATGHWTSLGYCPDADGKTIDDADNHCSDNYTAVERLMTAVGSVLGERYWTSTERTGKRFSFYVDFGRYTGVGMMTWSKTASCNVRSFIAF